MYTSVYCLAIAGDLYRYVYSEMYTFVHCPIIAGDMYRYACAHSVVHMCTSLDTVLLVTDIGNKMCMCIRICKG